MAQPDGGRFTPDDAAGEDAAARLGKGRRLIDQAQEAWNAGQPFEFTLSGADLFAEAGERANTSGLVVETREHPSRPGDHIMIIKGDLSFSLPIGQGGFRNIEAVLVNDVDENDQPNGKVKGGIRPTYTVEGRGAEAVEGEISTLLTNTNRGLGDILRLALNPVNPLKRKPPFKDVTVNSLQIVQGGLKGSISGVRR